MKALKLFVIILLLVSLCACARMPEPDATCACGPHSQPVCARAVRTNGGLESAEYPLVFVITSREALESYYEEKKSYFELSDFWDLCDRYDAAYFQTKELALIVLSENSGSISHEVTQINLGLGCKTWHIDVRRKIPNGPMTADLAQWHIIVELTPPHETSWDRTAVVTVEDGFI